MSRLIVCIFGNIIIKIIKDGYRLLVLEEELEKLDQGYEALIEWDVGCAKGRYNPERFKERLNKKELDDLYDTYDVN